MSTPVSLPQRRIDLHALIEEARRHARRRRIAAVLFLALIGGAVWTALAFTGGSAPAKAPPGFVLAKAHGPVAHAVVAYQSSNWRSTDISTGLDRPARVTEEVWYERKTGLWRDVFRVDGRVKSDVAGKCRSSPERLPCGSDYPLRYLRPYPWPPATSGYREAGRGSFDGRDVIWLDPRAGLDTPPNQSVTQIGLDPRTHRTLVERSFSGGRSMGALVISQRPNVAASHVRFLVPARRPVPVAPNALADPWSGLVLAYGFPSARKAFRAPPLWFGPSFRGYALRSVTSGVYRPRPEDGRPPKPIRFVRFYYGEGTGREPIISIEELGRARPYFQRQGPRPGFVERVGMTNARLIRRGLLLRVATDLSLPLTPKNAIAIARALRPLPPGLKTLPTLRQL